MLEFLSKYTGTIYINDTKLDNNDEFSVVLDKQRGDICIKLLPQRFINIQQPEKTTTETQYVFYVKPWMLEKSTPDFTFMLLWNNDKPMPLRYMVGTIEKQTTRLYYAKLRGYIPDTQTCSRCGRVLVNPVSKLLGIGPECACKVGINEEIFFAQSLDEEQRCKLRHNINNLYWEGWIPKTAVLSIKQP